MITSTRNRAIVATAKLHRTRERLATGKTLIEGIHLLEDAIAAGALIGPIFALADDRTMFALCDQHGFEATTVAPHVIERLALTAHPKGPVAVVDTPKADPLVATDTVVLAGVSDPGNAGTLIRSAAAFGFRVATTLHTVDVWSPRVLRAGAGAHFRTPMSRLGADPLGELRSAGLEPSAAVPGGGAWPPKGADHVAMLVGSEAAGLEPELIAGVDRLVTIPSSGQTESLNAAVAGSLIMFEVMRRRTMEGAL